MTAREPPPTLFQQHSETSRAAAASIAPSAGTLRAAVLAFIKSRGGHGATDSECQAFLGMQGSTQRPRRIELESAGLVRDSGQKRETGSGRRAIVWTST